MTNYSSSISSTSDLKSDCCATGSSSTASFWHVYNLHMSVHFRPLLRQVHLESLHYLTLLQDSSCKTASGADSKLAVLICHPAAVCWVRNKWLALQTSPDRSLVVCTQCKHEDAVLTRRELA